MANANLQILVVLISLAVLDGMSGCAATNRRNSPSDTLKENPPKIVKKYSYTQGQRFIGIREKSEVLDQSTKLIWQRCSFGQSWNGLTCKGEAKEMTYSQALQYEANNPGWRLPTAPELESLLTRIRDCGPNAAAKDYYYMKIPAIDQQYFPNTRAVFYWTSTVFSMDKNFKARPWIVGFACGETYGAGGSNYLVRLVRDSN